MAVINATGNALTGSTGTGAFVGANTPTLITPDIGAATGTSLNLGSTTTMTGMIDDDSMATASSSTAASSESVKAYVDAVAAGLEVKDSAVAASTAALTVTYDNGASGVGATLTNAGAQAAFSLDGVTPSVGARVLIKDQASTLQNGIYSVTNAGSGATNWVLTRTSDFDTAAEIEPGAWVPVDSGGTANGATSWLETATVVTIGTDPITFIQFTAALPVSLANGGTGANITADDGGIFYSNATTGAVLAATATAGLSLLSGSNTTPTWSTLPPITRTNVQVFGAGSATYTPTAGTKYIVVELVGGGGGGGGVTTGVGEGGIAGSGGAGGYCRKLFNDTELGANAAYTVGGGGAGSSGAGVGTTGTASTFNPAGTGATLTANGGVGGVTNTLVTAAVYGVAGQAAGGTATNGDLNIPGGDSGPGWILGANSLLFIGYGGGSALSGAPNGAGVTIGANNAGGNDGSAYGMGGSGAYCGSASTSRDGGAGAAGVLIVTEFISS